MSVVLPLIFLFLLPGFLFPSPLGAGSRDRLDWVGGERAHVADGVQQIVPGCQLVTDHGAAGLKSLQTEISHCNGMS